MINKVIIDNEYSTGLEFELRNPLSSSGVCILDVLGTSPGKATINTVKMGSLDGNLFNSSSRDQRNIVFDIAFPKFTDVEEARLAAYHCFPLKKEIVMTFETDCRKAQIKGYVEKVDIDQFQRFVTGQVSVICPDPNFIKVAEDGSTEIIVEFEDGSDTLEILYDGDVDTGFVIEGVVEVPQYNGRIYVGSTYGDSQIIRTGDVGINFTRAQDIKPKDDVEHYDLKGEYFMLKDLHNAYPVTNNHPYIYSNRYIVAYDGDETESERIEQIAGYPRTGTPTNYSKIQKIYYPSGSASYIDMNPGDVIHTISSGQLHSDAYKNLYNWFYLISSEKGASIMAKEDDRIIIDTKQGSKEAYLLRNIEGIDYKLSIIILTYSSNDQEEVAFYSWPFLKKGNNIISKFTSDGYLINSIKYSVYYEGI